jgi:hypothetical protein
VLGQGALTSPEHFRNPAHREACSVQRTRIKRTARSDERDPVDALTSQDHLGRTQNRPQFAFVMNRILAGNADAINL